MYEPKTEYVKGKLRKTRWKDRNYICSLLELERHVESGGKITGFTHGILIHGLKGEYPDEYIEILKELNPRELKSHLRRKALEEHKAAKISRELKETLKKHKEAWLKAGGKP